MARLSGLLDAVIVPCTLFSYCGVAVTKPESFVVAVLVVK